MHGKIQRRELISFAFIIFSIYSTNFETFLYRFPQDTQIFNPNPLSLKIFLPKQLFLNSISNDLIQGIFSRSIEKEKEGHSKKGEIVLNAMLLSWHIKPVHKESCMQMDLKNGYQHNNRNANGR